MIRGPQQETMSDADHGSNDQRVRIYLYILCLLLLLQLQSQSNVCLFVSLLNNPLSASTISTISTRLLSRALPTRPSLQCNRNTTPECDQTMASVTRSVDGGNGNCDMQTRRELQQLHDHGGSASNIMSGVIIISSNNTVSDACNSNTTMLDAIPAQLNSSTTRTCGRWREEKCVMVLAMVLIVDMALAMVLIEDVLTLLMMIEQLECKPTTAIAHSIGCSSGTRTGNCSDKMGHGLGAPARKGLDHVGCRGQYNK